jgi:hypothetical protein
LPKSRDDTEFWDFFFSLHTLLEGEFSRKGVIVTLFVPSVNQVVKLSQKRAGIVLSKFYILREKKIWREKNSFTLFSKNLPQEMGAG